MARSLRHTPIAGYTTARSEKRDKRLANRRLRAAVRSAMRRGDEFLPGLRDVSNPWTFDKDGKHWSLVFLTWQWRGR
jgi:hypothetical protein